MTQSQIMSILITIVCAALFLVIHFWEKTAKKETKSQKLKSNSAKAPLLHQEFKLKYSMFSSPNVREISFANPCRILIHF